MKKKELNNLRNKTVKEMETLESKTRADIEKARQDLYAGKGKNTRKVKTLRHELAQILTVKTEIEKKQKGEKKVG